MSLVALRLSHYSSQFPWWYSDYPYTHHSLLKGTQSIPLLIIFSLIELRLSLYSSKSPSWYSNYPFTHHSLSGGTQTIPILTTVYLVALTIPILITVSLVVLRLSIYSRQSPWWYSDYLYTHHSLPSGTQTIALLITVSLVVLRLSLYSSQSLVVFSLSLSISHSVWWYSEYPYTHHSLSGGTQNIPILITVSLVVLRLYLYSSQSP